MIQKKPPYWYAPEIDDDQDTAKEIVNILYQLFHPASVVDFGCGLGNFIRKFKEKGVDEVLGIDGAWAQSNDLFKLTNPDEFMEADLNRSIQLPRRFDLAICLEVAEHLPSGSADILVGNLTAASDIIVFSAAIPGQGGIHHINEQWIQYWEKKFKQKGFVIHDVLRPIIWNNERIKWWYRQNIFLVTAAQVEIKHYRFMDFYTPEPVNYLHPGLLKNRNGEIEKIINGKEGLRFYFRLLWKGLKNRFGINYKDDEVRFNK